jgi:tRNA-(MS[2]IO[6]A)-hydroxylase (MiaE)-like
VLVFSLFGRRGKTVAAPKLKPRSQASGADAVNRVALAELTPSIVLYLGQAACLQLLNFENLTGLIASAPTISNKTALAKVASLSLQKYEGLVAEIRTHDGDVASYIEPFSPRIEAFQQATRGGDWYEGLVTSYVTAGILDDFFIALAEGLPDGPAARIRTLLSGNEGSRIIVGELSASTATNPRLASRLALWGRRLVGDTLLIARSALAVPENQHPDEARLEPVFTELIAAHTRRMDDLGLTA